MGQIIESMAVGPPVRVTDPSDSRERQADQLAGAALRGEAREPSRDDVASPTRRASAPGLVPGGGEALPERVRERFEATLGRRLDHVRLHHGEQADALATGLNAEAYIVGDDIVMGGRHADPYAPGRQSVLMHELAHYSLGHGQDGAVMRKISTKPGVSLEPYYARRKKAGETAKANSPRGNPVSGPLAPITTPYSALSDEIVEAMKKSTRTFKVDGKTNEEAAMNLESHVDAREGIAEFTRLKRYAFGAGSAMKMNPTYWEKKDGRFEVKPGVDNMTAYKDVNDHPEQYAIACQMATDITMQAGSGGAVIVTDVNVPQTDWVPGDYGYVRNIGFTRGVDPVGTEGENIIYVGGGKYWGHLGPKNEYLSLDEWLKRVEGWNQFAMVEGTRMRPKTGLADK